MNINKTAPVMLTGATGYVGGQIAKKLIKNGHIVHAPVRNKNNKYKTQPLIEIAEKASGEIKFFDADLLKPGSYNDAIKGCEVVIHTASPYAINVKNPQKDLVDPALKGTENVMTSVMNEESVKRVVITSSCAAIYGDAKDIVNYPNQIMTEDIWNTTSTLKRSPYSYSKVLAEKKAWEMTQGQDRFDLVVINPSFVIGPAVNPDANFESYNLVKQFGDGTMKMGAPDLQMGFVDVRDVAEAHYRAAFIPKAQGRYICSAENQTYLNVVDMLRPKYGDKYPFPKKKLPKWLLMIVGPMAGIPRQFIRDNVGYPWKADNSKIKNELNIEFRPIKDSINEFFGQIEAKGDLK